LAASQFDGGTILDDHFTVVEIQHSKATTIYCRGRRPSGATASDGQTIQFQLM
jgi:hypothetical protein